MATMDDLLIKKVMMIINISSKEPLYKTACLISAYQFQKTDSIPIKKKAYKGCNYVITPWLNIYFFF